jgi:DNA-binding transcriptional regulator YhcF (GntR family)
MNPRAINMLLLLRNSPAEAEHIRRNLDITKRQLQRIIKELSNSDYISSNGKIALKINAKTALFKKVANKFDAIKLMHDSNEGILLKLITPKSISELTKETGLSQVTVYRALSELRSVGAVTEDDGKFILSQDNDLQLFVNLLKTERERIHVEPYAEILYSGSKGKLKGVPAGQRASGELTAFSVFTNYGIKYHSVNDYYVEQEEPISIEDILIHSLVAADKENDKTALIMVIVFYIKNRDRMVLDRIRRTARSFNVHELWLDIEAYLRKLPVKYKEKFLPWEEFEQKAKLYGLTDYELPPAYPQLFKDIGKRMEQPVEIYLFGGENMRLKGLKNLTKDCDIVVRNRITFRLVKDLLIKMGYQQLGREHFSEDDKRINPSAIMVHPHRSRVDLFTEQIANKLYLSEGMVKRSDIQEFNKLKLGIMSNEDIFLLKSVTEREGDIVDMARLAQSAGFNWDVVFNELIYQERESGRYFSEDLLYSLDLLKERANIESPFYRKLSNRVLDNAIVYVVTKGKTTIKEIKELIDFPEYIIRNRVNKLARQKRLRKEVRSDGTIILTPS